MSADGFDVFIGLQSCNYSAMAAIAFTAWDICITTDDEVRQIWKRPWTRLKSLYLFLRFFPLGSQISFAVLTMRLATRFPFSVRGCSLLVGAQGLSSQILQLAVQVLIILRLQALYHSNKILRRFLHCCFFAEVSIMIVVFVLKFSAIRYGPQCAVIYIPVAVVGFFGPPIVFESLLFLLTMAKFYAALREGWGQEPIISRFMKDGIWAFALPFVSLTVNTCCMTLLDSSISSIAFPWVIAVPGFAGYRLILNMSHLLKAGEPEESRFMIDTVTAMVDGSYPSSGDLSADVLPYESWTSPPPLLPMTRQISNLDGH